MLQGRWGREWCPPGRLMRSQLFKAGRNRINRKDNQALKQDLDTFQKGASIMTAWKFKVYSQQLIKHTWLNLAEGKPSKCITKCEAVKISHLTSHPLLVHLLDGYSMVAIFRGLVRFKAPAGVETESARHRWYGISVTSHIDMPLWYQQTAAQPVAISPPFCSVDEFHSLLPGVKTPKNGKGA